MLSLLYFWPIDPFNASVKRTRRRVESTARGYVEQLRTERR